MDHKREPITIDVEPEKIQVERPRVPVKPDYPVPQKRERQPRPRSLVKQARDARRLGRIVQQPDFWIGLIAELWMRGR